MDSLLNIKRHFKYNPQTGEIKRLTRANSNGSKDKDGYLIIKFMRKQIKAHRLIWFLEYGFWPKGVIDHINGDKTDNRIKNLRDVPQSINVIDTKRQPNKETGYIGIYIDKTAGLKKRFATRHNKKTYRFLTINEAINFKKLNYEQTI